MNEEKQPVSAWLIELNPAGGPLWLTLSGGLDIEDGLAWTQNANAALKFADRESALLVGKYLFVDPLVTEHQWPDGFGAQAESAP